MKTSQNSSSIFRFFLSACIEDTIDCLKIPSIPTGFIKFVKHLVNLNGINSGIASPNPAPKLYPKSIEMISPF